MTSTSSLTTALDNAVPSYDSRIVCLDLPVEIPALDGKQQSDFELWPEYRIHSDGFVVDSKTNRPCPVVCDAKGYFWVFLLRKDGTNRVLDCVPMSRLVAISFHGAPNTGQRACFVDGNRCRNDAENVQWMSHTESLKCPRFYSQPKIEPKLESKSFLFEVCQRYRLPVFDMVDYFTLRRGWLANCIVKFRKFAEPQEISRIFSDFRSRLIPEAMMIIEQANPSWTTSQVDDLKPSHMLALIDLTRPMATKGKNKRNAASQYLAQEGKHTNHNKKK